MGIQLLEINSLKKKAPQCSIYDMSKYSLKKCWYIFDELKSQEIKLASQCIKKTKKKMEDNEQLTTQIKKIQEKMKKKVRFKD